mmetsp:Transcript_67898/g.133547  ORF Transcript_67898/g.133547 Transcript_67898/m.133547 type:complete len:410 (+) Transcript_67898:17-1246(+)
MSDARAKAEARRAKILARESSMKVTAIGDDLTLPVEGKAQERPLAKRRNLVKAISEKSLDVDCATPTKGDAPTTEDEVSKTEETPTKDDVKVGDEKEAKKVLDDDPEVESIEQHSEKQDDTSASSPTPKSQEEKEALLKKLSPKKTLKEIEEEVARNTAKYDEDTLKAEKPVGMKRAKVNKETAMKNKAAAATSSSNNINPTNVTRLIRMFVIIFMGVYKGYYATLSNMNSRDNAMIMAMEGVSMQSASQPVQSITFDEFGEPIVEISVEQQQQQQETKPSRTWGQWVQYKMTAPFESTVTAVGISYWIANMLSAGINSRLKSAPKPKGILEQAMALYQSGFEGLLERVFCLFGEYALHMGTILLATTVLSLYMEGAAVNASASAGTLANAAVQAVQEAVTTATAQGEL